MSARRHRALALVQASLPPFCDVCRGDRRVALRVADDPAARWAVIPCPHCGPLNLPAVLTRRRSA